jgi:hypothetical protein
MNHCHRRRQQNFPYPTDEFSSQASQREPQLQVVPLSMIHLGKQGVSINEKKATDHLHQTNMTNLWYHVSNEVLPINTSAMISRFLHSQLC